LEQPVRVEKDPNTGFKHGLTDRPPPMYVGTVGVVRDGFERLEDCQSEAGDCERLCPNPLEVPWWAPAEEDVDGTARRQIECRRGVRVTYGPWQTGTSPRVDDRVAEAVVRFENSAHLDADGATDPSDRWEWNVASELYNNFGSHHATCWNPGVGIGQTPLSAGEECNDPEDPATATDMEQCGEYQAGADTCPASDPRFECPGYSRYNQQFRNATQYPGRLFVDLPEGRAAKTLQNQLWGCDHHVVTYQTADSGTDRSGYHDYRNQKGGLVAKHDEGDWNAGEVIGGAVGEMIIQLFTAPRTDGNYKPLSVGFDVVTNVATTYFPPYTIGNSGGIWYAPYDLAVGILAIHSHKRMVKGTIDVVPANPIRTSGLEENPDPNITNESCGVSDDGLPPEHIYVDWHWDDAPVCRYYKQPDGPLILRKGDALVTRCLVNNGVIQSEQAPEPVRSSIRNGIVGQEVLFGRQDPLTYRVRYGCEQIPGVPPGYPYTPAQVCPPNPDTNPPGCVLGEDPDCHPVDGRYLNPDICTSGTGYCAPANVVFANVAEDEMCIGVVMYWPLDPLVTEEGVNQEAVDAIQSDPNNADDYGTPGRLPKSPTDIGYCSGCGPGL
ncbi:MAG: hypothetical protein ACREQ9_03785, partial [Candidatus Binatia bacterium]